MTGRRQRAPRAGNAARREVPETAGSNGHAVVHPRRISMGPAMLERLPPGMRTRLLHASDLNGSSAPPSADPASQPGSFDTPIGTQPAETEANATAWEEASPAATGSPSAQTSSMRVAQDAPVMSLVAAPPPQALSLVQIIGSRAASPNVRDQRQPWDTVFVNAAEERGAGELVRQSSMTVHPSTTLDRWPEAEPDQVSQPVLADPDELDPDLDDWTPVRRLETSAPRAEVISGESSSSVADASAAGAAMYSRAMASRLRKQAW